MAASSLLAAAGLVVALGPPGQAATHPAGTPGIPGAAPVAAEADAAVSGTKSPSHAQQRAQLEHLARKLVAAGAPGVIVRVDDGRGKPVEIAEQAPWTRRDHRLRADDEFRMGSNTKTMMATLVLQLVGEGKLALTDPVRKWLPGQVPNGDATTLRMLLNHTSGLYDYTEDPAMVPSILGKDRTRWTPERLLAVGVRHDPKFPPGTKWAYSNTNYAAIGAVLEKVTGKSLAELVRDRIARPLNLKHTYYATDSSLRGRHARGYEPDAAHMPPGVPAEFKDYAGTPRHGHVDVSRNNPSWGGPAGAMVSTAHDWGRFYTALMSGKLLPAAQLAQMRTTVPTLPDQPKGPGYGLGIATAPTPCGTVWTHDGGIPGYLSVNFTDSTGGRTATVLVSTEAFAEFPEAFPKIDAAAKELQTAAMCTMFDKPAPTD
ncbi:serine hydrolase domain-containing protein [Streptomyces aureoverticillatus]|uniref:serine hydrolase domain-containing protein n=1 Tax=Streptomyces aureoverticillatus TaxID=66871 RepID=UPI0019543F19|nr:serine hydrolase domain-containing protein [Streptomyces aureoverticillatus]